MSNFVRDARIRDRFRDDENSMHTESSSAPKRRKISTIVSKGSLVTKAAKRDNSESQLPSSSEISRTETRLSNTNLGLQAPTERQHAPEIRLVRAYTPLLTQEEEFSQAEAQRKELVNIRGRALRLSATKEVVRRRTHRYDHLPRAIKSTHKIHPPSISKAPQVISDPTGGARMTPYTNRTFTSARTTVESESEDDNEDSGSNSESDGFELIKPPVKLKLVEPRPPPTGVRSARKTFGHVVQHIEPRIPNGQVRDPFLTRDIEPMSDPERGNSEDETILNNMGLLTLNRKVVDANNNTEAAQTVATAISALPHHHLEEMLVFSRRLPFLRRNLRSATEWLALQRQKPVSGTMSHKSVEETPIMRLQFDIKALRVIGYRQIGWRCPLCPVFREYSFITRAGLEYHLSAMHPQISTRFECSNQEPVLHITLPDEPTSESPDSSDASERPPDSDDEDTSADETGVDGPIRLRSSTPEQKPFLRGPSIFMRHPSLSSSPYKRRDVNLIPSRSGIVPSAPEQPSRPPTPVDPTGKRTYPTPPPYYDLEGPACVPPITPASLGLPDDWYSTRPGGPHCYDALEVDEKRVYEELGMVAWHVYEQEEDIYELDNVLDADKAMRALWTRFIALHRREFVANYMEATQKFVTDNWLVIHRAAGFAALRIWLLVLVHNRFLEGVQLVELLKYYGDLVGIDHWQKRAPVNNKV